MSARRNVYKALIVGVVFVESFLDSFSDGSKAMIGENRQLVNDEAVEFEK
jgi:hypothetical protein